ncbi:hypothetical protein FBY37_6108 [Streptomyces sp. SLBN-134]|nr:hypothetical protein FBY37_6108 [Streptomyces sp. SLBN-134]
MQLTIPLGGTKSSHGITCTLYPLGVYMEIAGGYPRPVLVSREHP